MTSRATLPLAGLGYDGIVELVSTIALRIGFPPEISPHSWCDPEPISLRSTLTR